MSNEQHNIRVKVLASLIRSRGTDLTASQISKRTNFPEPEVQDSLDYLSDEKKAGLVRAKEDGTYAFRFLGNTETTTNNQ